MSILCSKIGFMHQLRCFDLRSAEASSSFDFNGFLTFSARVLVLPDFSFNRFLTLLSLSSHSVNKVSVSSVLFIECFSALSIENSVQSFLGVFEFLSFVLAGGTEGADSAFMNSVLDFQLQLSLSFGFFFE